MTGTGPCILLVEDNPDDEALTLRALRRGGVRNKVLVARDGAAALNTLLPTDPAAGEHEPIGVVLLDLNLPKIGGLEVLARIRADSRTRHLPVVILTSSHEDADLIDGYENGTNAYVVKPVDSKDFFAAVGLLGMFWLMTNEARPETAAH